MANYIPFVRSNYFKVKDPEKFKEFCAELSLDLIIKNDDHEKSKTLHPDNLYGFIINNDCGLPSTKYNEETDEHEEIDFFKLLAPHIADDHVAVIMEIGYEKMRYLTGLAWALNNKGALKSVSLEDIYDKAKELGTHVTDAAY